MSDNYRIDYTQSAFTYLIENVHCYECMDPERVFHYGSPYILTLEERVGLPKAQFNNKWSSYNQIGKDPREEDPNTNSKEYYTVEIVVPGFEMPDSDPEDELGFGDNSWIVVFKLGSNDVVFMLHHCD
jgi:hypothetical protein